MLLKESNVRGSAVMNWSEVLTKDPIYLNLGGSDNCHPKVGWDDGKFICKKIDYSFGMIRRTPDNDHRCRTTSLKQKFKVVLNDFMYKLLRGFRVSEGDLSVRPGHRLHVTSLVVDLFKD